MSDTCRDEIISILNRFNLNDLYNKGTDKITDHSYDLVYGPTLNRFRDKSGVLLEIGTWNGGSAVLWRNLLPEFRLELADNDLSHFNRDYYDILTNTRINATDAYTEHALDFYKNAHPNGYDIIIDDGPHTLETQLFFVTKYTELLKPNGVLIVEDIASIDNLQRLIDAIPPGYTWKKYDLRHVKNRYDDIALVVTKTESKIALFYHLGQFNHWKEVYANHIDYIKRTGLYDAADFIYVGINGIEPLPEPVPEKLVYRYNTNHILEANTLEEMWRFSNAHPDHKILYFHSKSVTRMGVLREQTEKWCAYMNSHLIGRWQECVNILDTYDTCGTLLRNRAVYGSGENYAEVNTTYYDGNFWWANANYIKKLDPKFLYRHDGIPWLRGKSELWIGSENPSAYCIHNIEYDNPYDCDFGKYCYE